MVMRSPLNVQIFKPWLFHRVIGRLLEEQGLPRRAIAETLPGICADLERNHGTDAMAAVLADIAIDDIIRRRPAGYDHITGEDIDNWIADKATIDAIGRPDSYVYQVLDVDTLRGGAADPLAEVLAYHAGLGDRPGAADFSPDTLVRFGGDIEPYHYLADIDLRSKDGDIRKFSFVHGGSQQPTLRGGAVDPAGLLIANHPYPPLADELSGRFLRLAYGGGSFYQKSDLWRAGAGVTYRALTLPLFGADGVCTHALVVMDDVKRNVA